MRANSSKKPFSPLAKLRLFWTRATSSKITAFYFCFSVLHCIAQVILQVRAYLVNTEADDLLTGLIQQGNAEESGFSVLTSHGLRVCDLVPKTFSSMSCTLVWDSSPDNDTTTTGYIGSAVNPVSSTIKQSTFSQTSAGVQNFMASTTELSSSLPTEKSTHDADVVTETVTFTTTVKATPTSNEDHSSPNSESTSIPISTSTLTPADRWVKQNTTKISMPQSKRAETTPTSQMNSTVTVHIDGFGWKNDTQLTFGCLTALNWPVERLSQTEREDLVFVLFQVWVLGMSIVALLNESMPHIIASLLTHFIATGYAAYQLSKTERFHEDFTFLVTQGACQPFNLLPTYWKQRGDIEISILALNAFAMILSALLSWKLIRYFGWQTFKRVGASRTISRLYRLVLSLSIIIQLSFFFVATSIGLWIDQLYHGAIGRMATGRAIFEPILITVLVLLVPWLTLGWIAVRREYRVQMLVFLVMSAGYLGGWSAMFDSPTFRWTFVQWDFFAIFVTISVALMLTTLVLGIVCRINFGKGLVYHLNPRQHVPLEDNQVVRHPSTSSFGTDVEKIDFPSTSLPVYRNSMHFDTPSLGPRFTNPPPQPFDSPYRPLILSSRPPSIYSSPTESVRYPEELHPSRTNSVKSNGSIDSYYSDSSHFSRKAPPETTMRWIIE